MMYNKQILPIIEEKIKIPLVIGNGIEVDNSIIFGLGRNGDYRKDKEDESINKKNIAGHTPYLKREQRNILGFQDVLLIERRVIGNGIFEALKSYNFYEKIENQNDQYYKNINEKLKGLGINDIEEFISQDVKKISNFLSGLSYNEYKIMLSIIENKMENNNESYEIRKLAEEKRFKIIAKKFKNNKIITEFFNHPGAYSLSQEKINDVVNYFITKYKNYTDLEEEIRYMFVKMQKYEHASIMKDIYKAKTKMISIIYEALNNI